MVSVLHIHNYLLFYELNISLFLCPSTNYSFLREIETDQPIENISQGRFLATKGQLNSE